MLGGTVIANKRLLTRIVNINDILVIHLRYRMSFTAETSQEDLVFGQISAHNFDRHRAAKTRIETHINLGHSSMTDRLAELITSVSQR